MSVSGYISASRWNWQITWRFAFKWTNWVTHQHFRKVLIHTKSPEKRATIARGLSIQPEIRLSAKFCTVNVIFPPSNKRYIQGDKQFAKASCKPFNNTDSSIFWLNDTLRNELVFVLSRRRGLAVKLVRSAVNVNSLGEHFCVYNEYVYICYVWLANKIFPPDKNGSWFPRIATWLRKKQNTFILWLLCVCVTAL